MVKDKVLFTRVTEEQAELFEKLADTQGISISEYLRSLIIQELRKFSLITTKIDLIKEEIRKSKT